MFDNNYMALVEKIVTLERRVGDIRYPEITAPVISSYLALPGLRGFWPMSSVGDGGLCEDLSGQGRDLTYNGNPVYGFDNIAPYIDFDGTGDYLSRADESGLDILGNESYIENPGLTLGGWFNFTNVTQIACCMGKIGGLVTNTSYFLNYRGDLSPKRTQFGISDSSSFYTIGNQNGPNNADEWNFLAGRLTPSTEIKQWINNITASATTSIPATTINTSVDFTIGAYSTLGVPLSGKASMCFLCTAALSDTIINHLYQVSRGMFGV